MRVSWQKCIRSQCGDPWRTRAAGDAQLFQLQRTFLTGIFNDASISGIPSPGRRVGWELSVLVSTASYRLASCSLYSLGYLALSMLPDSVFTFDLKFNDCSGFRHFVGFPASAGCVANSCNSG